jgi:PST family polysaccharide transporter
MKHVADLNIIGGIIYAGSIFFFVKGPDDYLMVPIINSAVSLIVGILAQYIIFRKFRINFKYQGYSSVKQQLKAGWDIFISIAAINAYTTTRVFMIGLFTNNTLTGYYSIAERIANVCQTFPLWSFSQAIFPRLSAIYHRNKKKAYEIMVRIQEITILISLICLPIVFIFSERIIKIVCGGDYATANLSLRLLLIAVFFVSANAFRVQFLLVCGKTEIFSRIHVVMAIIGLPLIVLLTYSYSYIGAAVATVIIEAGIFTVTFFTVRRIKFVKSK